MCELNVCADRKIARTESLRELNVCEDWKIARTESLCKLNVCEDRKIARTEGLCKLNSCATRKCPDRKFANRKFGAETLREPKCLYSVFTAVGIGISPKG